MPLDVRCPSCNATFPVSETGRASTVQCPYCDAAFDASQDRPAAAAGTANLASGPAAPAKKGGAGERPARKDAAGAAPARRRRRDEDDEDEDDRGRRGPDRSGAKGSALMLILFGGGGLLFVIVGLGLTAWLIFSGSGDEDKDPPAAAAPVGPKAPSRPNPQPDTQPRVETPPRTGPQPKADPQPGPGPRPNPFPPAPAGFALEPDPGRPVPITPPALEGDGPVPVTLPGKVESAQVGGNGRYVVLHLRDRNELAVFDVTEAKVTNTLRLEGDREVYYAAGRNRLAVAYPDRRLLSFFSLPELRPEGSGTPPGSGRAVGLAMGSATNGPVLVGTPGELSLFDPQALRTVDGSTKVVSSGVPIQPGVQLRAAANGRLFTATRPTGAVSRTALFTVKDGKWSERSIMAYPPLPGPEGDVVYANVQVFGPDGQRLGGKVGGPTRVWYVPAAHGRYVARLGEKKEGLGPNARHWLTLAVHADRDTSRELVPAFDLPEGDGLVEWPSGVPQPLDRFVFLIPDAKLLAVIPPKTPDRVVLRRVDVK